MNLILNKFCLKKTVICLEIVSSDNYVSQWLQTKWDRVYSLRKSHKLPFYWFRKEQDPKWLPGFRMSPSTILNIRQTSNYFTSSIYKWQFKNTVEQWKFQAVDIVSRKLIKKKKVNTIYIFIWARATWLPLYNFLLMALL